jgi:cell wall-associated NlpC family hydrolase
MQVASPVPNHAAVYLGDGLILHHLQGRLSSRDVYGGYWQKVTTHALRHPLLFPLQ